MQGEAKFRVPRHMAGTLDELNRLIVNDGHALDGADPLADNVRRASFALAALNTYREVCRGSEDAITTVTDFLSDLMHLVDACSNDDGECETVDWLTEIASTHFEAEIRGVL